MVVEAVIAGPKTSMRACGCNVSFCTLYHWKKRVKITHDTEPDVAYVSYGEPRRYSVAEELDDDVLVARDPVTREMSGLTITDFSHYFKQKKEMKIDVGEN
ncbi:MAG: hypothetical protein ACREBS_06845 [Nitrososphaerales archaeon]